VAVSDTCEKKFCVIVPAYREGGRIGEVVRGILKHAAHVVVVDDGSPDNTAGEAEKAGATVLRHGVNRGKGIALNTGFDYARKNGFEFVITLDADGQHDPEEIPRFVETYRRTGTPVLIGNRMDRADAMPLVRRWTNRYMSRLLSRRMGQRVPDTQVGYRLYRCDVIPQVPEESGRFAAESEILLLLAEKGIAIGAVPIQVIYRGEKSKINPIRDTLRFYRMLRRHRKRRDL
jgi:glycosyltransferase involved in cell wall biosynthesis